MRKIKNSKASRQGAGLRGADPKPQLSESGDGQARLNAGVRKEKAATVSKEKEPGPLGTGKPPDAGRQDTGASREERPVAAPVSGDGSDGFPVVGIGASAGGLAAFETLFAHMPPESKTGIAFVIVQHLDPNHKSILTELVRRYTTMQVFEVADGMAVQPNCAYIIRPNKDMVLQQGKLHLLEPSERRGLRLPIDFFFRSLAQDRGEHAIGIILSGNGTDGTLGLRAIKEAGGMGLVQEPSSAEFDGMPRSAIAGGLADFILPPDEMPAQLLAYVSRTSKTKVSPAAPVPADVSGWLLKIMAMLRAHNGHDLSYYKQNTVRRRVERRMALNQIDGFENYIRLLRQNRGELDTLFRELLIGVTSFFRDNPAFEAVRELALPAILADRPLPLPIRVWVPACSTGEEAYSLAMLLEESAKKLGRDYTVQIFATDIDHDSIERARAGVYPASIAADVPAERLSRFFTHQEKDFYRIKKSLREQVIFAEQDVIKDPPFSKLDLISCRNMLIYMEPVLQRRLIPLFHYALAPGGFLVLGTSESVGDFSNLFKALDRKWKLYRKKDMTFAGTGQVAIPNLPVRRQKPAARVEDSPEQKKPLREITERMLLRNYSPACVVVSEQGEILYVHGRSGKYLELPAGDANMNLLRSAREGMKVELANAMRKVLTTRQPVHYKGLEVRTNGGFEPVNVTVELAEGKAGASNILLVTFQDAPPKPAAESTAFYSDKAPASSTPPDEKDVHIASLERELRLKTESLQTTVEELEASNEELKSTNEELQSTNEELQSTNEELETSKEELQSVNEELTTVNNELQEKMEGLARANNDMNNLLAGTGIGMLFVDHSLHIQRFTPAITQIINLIHSDVGRPVGDLVSNLVDYDHLGEHVKAVLDTLIPRESEVRVKAGNWYQMRILPYRTIENVIEGAVLTFTDIGAQKRAEAELRALSVDLEKRISERMSELMTANKSLATEIGHRQEMESRATDVSAMRCLHDLTFRIARQTELPKLLQTTLAVAVELAHADKGMIQLYDGEGKSRGASAQQGFNDSFLKQFDTIVAHTEDTWGDPLRRGFAVATEDVAASPNFKGAPALGLLRAAGVRAIHSMPVIAREGRLLAVFSTAWNKPFKLDDDSVRLLDLLARQLADLMEEIEREKKAQK